MRAYATLTTKYVSGDFWESVIDSGVANSKFFGVGAHTVFIYSSLQTMKTIDFKRN